VSTLGATIKSARERRKLASEYLASNLNMDVNDYKRLEEGQSELEKWGRILPKIAIKLSVPTSRLIAKTGKYINASEGKVGELIRERREKRKISDEELAKLIDLPLVEYRKIEDGLSPLEKIGPMMLHCAEVLDYPVFNLLHTWD
jgi:transcriptional regulator with XRE-family HTH domain